MNSRRSSATGLHVPFLVVLASALLALEPSCLDRREGEELVSAPDRRCTSCHGNPDRPGDFLQRSAPPRDLLEAADPSYPGVGAHLIHVYGSETHGPVACNECHVVPERTDTPGHADDQYPAELVFGTTAKGGGREPSYDSKARTCENSYCHREADAIWTAPRSTEQACGSCHGLPPPAPHPQSERCEACHSEVIDAGRRFVRPELHVDGKLQFLGGACTTCHGKGDDPAPPSDTLGNDSLTAIGVGAHQAHLQGGAASRPLACTECHAVPERVDSTGHADALPAEVALSGVATTGARAPRWDRNTTTCADGWCHGPGLVSLRPSPSWIMPGPLGCTGCHASPPPSPHPQVTDCSRCHAAVVAEDDRTIIARNRHVDGIIDVSFDEGCTTCHGSVNPAPPADLSGATSTSSPGVGAHQVHLAGTQRSRAVPCGECHKVPSEALATGHMDTPAPAELIFSGAAVAFGGAPSYVGGACLNTACHGGVFPAGHASGGSNTAPSWTLVDGIQAACGACHGLPPPRPHPRADLNPVCNACHKNIATDNSTFLRSELHVDGIVTFDLP